MGNVKGDYALVTLGVKLSDMCACFRPDVRQRFGMTRGWCLRCILGDLAANQGRSGGRIAAPFQFRGLIYESCVRLWPQACHYSEWSVFFGLCLRSFSRTKSAQTRLLHGWYHERGSEVDVVHLAEAAAILSLLQPRLNLIEGVLFMSSH